MSITRNKWVVFLIISFFYSCYEKKAEGGNDDQSTKLKIAVVNYPLLFFAQTIGQEDIEIVYPIPSDEDPAYWNPVSDQIAEFQNADIIFINGAGYARWIDNVSLPASKIVNTTSGVGVEEKFQVMNEGPAHSHGPEGEHTHSEYAFTTWLDLSIAKSQAEVIYEAIVEAMPENEQEISERYTSLRDQLDLLHKELDDALKVRKGYYGSHPVYQYLASGYGVEIVSVHWEPGENITTEQWHEFEELMDHGFNIMLWEGEPGMKTKALLKEKGIESVLFNPTANKPPEGDFITIMRSNIDALKFLEFSQ